MKVGILTFQFAHNYGAMLQTYALKRYLELQEQEVSVLPYFPTHFQAQYSINPLVRGISLKRRVCNLLYFVYNLPQTRLFEDFKKNYIYEKKGTKEFREVKYLQPFCDEVELFVFGSDQIWNTGITQMDATYFGKGLEGRKIAYAASLGSKEHMQDQLHYFKEFLLEFEAISVREPDAKLVIEQTININTNVVCDPVFLLEDNEWKELESCVDIEASYILLYMLEDNKELLELTYECAKKHGLTIYEIHPTLAIKHEGTQLLKNIGPQEFIYLINHAEYVCTNSFHGVCFSIIFKKKLIHMPNTKSPGRTLAILDRVGVRNTVNNIFRVDLSECSHSRLQGLVNESKVYLDSFL